MPVNLDPIGTAHTDAATIPRHWTVSDVEGTLVIDPRYTDGLSDISAGQQIVVLFHFHKSAPFSSHLLKANTTAQGAVAGCVQHSVHLRRPNPIGMSVLTVLARSMTMYSTFGETMDMIDGTPILDIKPFIFDKRHLPSRRTKATSDTNPEYSIAPMEKTADNALYSAVSIMCVIHHKKGEPMLVYEFFASVLFVGDGQLHYPYIC